jgi:predicted transcriptional regulator
MMRFSPGTGVSMGRRQYRKSLENRLFHFLRSPLEQIFGPLERQVLSVLWRRGSATVHEVMKGGVHREYTTVMTTLNRLFTKGLLDREVEPHSNRFRYFPRHRTKGEWERVMVIQTVRYLLSSNSDVLVPLSYLVEAIKETDPKLLDELQRLVKAQRSMMKSHPLRDRRS